MFCCCSSLISTFLSVLSSSSSLLSEEVKRHQVKLHCMQTWSLVKQTLVLLLCDQISSTTDSNKRASTIMMVDYSDDLHSVNVNINMYFPLTHETQLFKSIHPSEGLCPQHFTLFIVHNLSSHVNTYWSAHKPSMFQKNLEVCLQTFYVHCSWED